MPTILAYFTHYINIAISTAKIIAGVKGSNNRLFVVIDCSTFSATGYIVEFVIIKHTSFGIELCKMLKLSNYFSI